MKAVTNLYRHPSEHDDIFEEQVLEWITDATKFIKGHKLGKVTGGAMVLTTDKQGVITSYAGLVRTFTIVGAFKHMCDRIFREELLEGEDICD